MLLLTAQHLHHRFESRSGELQVSQLECRHRHIVFDRHTLISLTMSEKKINPDRSFSSCLCDAPSSLMAEMKQ